MKTSLRIICVVLALVSCAVTVRGQTNSSLYEQYLTVVGQSPAEQLAQNIADFVALMSKDTFRQFLGEYARQRDSALQPREMPHLVSAYYKSGAGKNDEFNAWCADIQDRSLPTAWRVAIIETPPFVLYAALRFDEASRCAAAFRAIALAANETHHLRYTAITGYEIVLKLEKMRPEQIATLGEVLSAIALDKNVKPETRFYALGRLSVYVGVTEGAAAKRQGVPVIDALAGRDPTRLEAVTYLTAEEKARLTAIIDLARKYDKALAALREEFPVIRNY